MHHLADLLKEMKLNAKGIRLGYDNNGYLDINGYDGPMLSEVVAGRVETVSARDIVDRLRSIKSDAELALIKESCVWGNLAHRLMHDGIQTGRGAIDVGLQASVEASRMMIAALGPGYEQMSSTFGFPASAVFSAGASTAMPHGLSSAMGLRAWRCARHVCRRRRRGLPIGAGAHDALGEPGPGISASTSMP